MRRTEFFAILGHFLPFDSPDNSTYQNFEKMRKMLEDIIILHLSTTNDDHMIYGSSHIERGRLFFYHFQQFFAFTPQNNLKNQNFEKTKKC